MRHFAKILVPALLVVLSACSSKPQLPTPKLEQKGALKVHPGLLGLPVPAELRALEEKPANTGETAATGHAATQAASRAAADAGKTAAPPPSSLGSFYFDFKEASIRPEHIRLIDEHAARLKANRKALLRIEGHADERGPDSLNMALGMKRARSVRQALIAKGVKRGQIKVLSFGKTRPKVRGHDEASWAENRRADLAYERE